MTAGRTRVLLSFSSAFAALARRIARDLGRAGLDVRFDQWHGGGGVPGQASLAPDFAGVRFVLPLLTPSEAASTWIGPEWIRAVHDEAHARGIEVLPVRGDGGLDAIPDLLRSRSFADLTDRRYAPELRRLIETIRTRSGDAGVTLPDDGAEAATGHGDRTPADPPVVLEVGEQLAPLFNGDAPTSFSASAVPMMYDGLFYELGVSFPGLRVRSGLDLAPSSIRVVLNGVPELQSDVRPDAVLVDERAGALANRRLAAEPAVNPATGADCSWIPASDETAAREAGLTTWDAQAFVVLTLSAVLRRRAADFVGVDEVRSMLDRVEPAFPALVAETVPKTVSLFVLTDVLRRLVAELVSIRDLRSILMALADWGRVEHDPHLLTEHVRATLRRQITFRLSRGTNQLAVLLLHPSIERNIGQAIRHTATGSFVDLRPDDVRRILDAIRVPMDALPNNVQVPQILTAMEIRSSVRRLVSTAMPRLHVVSYQELRPDARIEPIGRITLDGFEPRSGVMVNGEALWPQAGRP